MTDLEKAIELARKHEALYGMRNREECCVAACQEMAEWKERQMIEKVCEWLKSNLITIVTDDYIYTASIHNISREEFIEQFKKAMKE